MFAFSSEHFKCMFSNPNYELARKETDSITALDIPDDRKKMLVKKIEEKYLADFVPNVVRPEEIQRMKENLKSKPWKWDQDLIRNKMTKGLDYNTVRFSVPLINTYKNYAIMFLKFDNSIEAHVYKKEGDIWMYYCYYPVSISG